MASTSSYNSLVYNSKVKSNRNLANTTSFSADLLFPLFLSLLLFAFFFLHYLHSDIHLPPTPSSLLHYLLSPLSFLNISPPPLSSTFSATQLLYHHLALLLSPFPIFLFANLIIFTLLFKTFYLSPAHSSPATSLSDFPDFASGKFNYGGSTRPEYALVQSHADFFFSSPPHVHSILSSDPVEEYQVLSLGTAVEEAPYFAHLQSFDKVTNGMFWQQAKGVSYSNTDSRVTLTSKDQSQRQDIQVMHMPEKVHMPIAACKMSSVEQGRQPEKPEISFKTGKLDERPCITRCQQETASNCSSLNMANGGSQQAVVINLEPAMITGRPPRSVTPTSQPPAPPASPPTPSHPRQPAILKVPNSSTSTNMFMQRPPSSPRAKKSLHQNTGSATLTLDGRSSGGNNVKPVMLDNEKQAAASKPQLRRSVPHHQSSLVRSYSDHRLSQENPRLSDVTYGTTSVTGSSSPTSNRRPQVQKARSCNSSVIDNLLTSSFMPSTDRPQMQRTQSLKSGSGRSRNKSSPAAGNASMLAPSSSPQQPSVNSEAMDALSDADANKRFSNFIAQRFAAMKKELIDAPSSITY
ncbi:hypothetical protein L7F22_035937 [Adiantum nelumboides]|nr:hypothetical protein [Adiantum nelumboides]